MPLLNKNEMDSGVRFEVKKYLPSRTEELISDHQERADKRSGKMDVLFVATTQSSFDRYFSLLEQAGISVRAVEPASLSLMRLFSFDKNIGSKSSLAVVSIQGMDVEFSILIEGFPCYNRDIKLAILPALLGAGNEDIVFLERLSSEIRVSLDYFRRQFSGRAIDKAILIVKNTPVEIAGGLSKNLGIEVQAVDLSGNSKLNALADLDMLKSYSLAIRDNVKINLTVNLLKKRRAQTALEEASAPFVLDITMLKRPLIQGALVLGGLFLFFILVTWWVF